MVWRTVRVFVSSTFRDMHAERDHLVKVVFPELRERLLLRRVHLIDVDLRWGIPRNEAENDRTLALCLEQIDACRPYFIAMLGQRYGSVLSDAKGRSVTELEIAHAVFDNPELRHRAAFFLRSPAFLANTSGAARAIYCEDASAAEIAIHGAAAAQARAEYRRLLLTELKQRILDGEHGAYVRDGYPCSWDEQLEDRANGVRGRISGLDEFGNDVLDQLERMIVADLGDDARPRDPLQRDDEGDLQETFIEARLFGRVARPALEREIDRALAGGPGADENSRLIAVVGPEGSGKSTQLARCVRELEQHEPATLVLHNFPGVSPASSDVQRVCERLVDQLGPPAGASPTDDATEIASCPLANALARTGARAPVVLVLDALERFHGPSGDVSLAWLPDPIPSGVRVIVAVDDASDRGRLCLAELGRRAVTTVEVKPLGTAERRAIIDALPLIAAKLLEPPQVDRLLASDGARDPLFLRIALEELRRARSYAEVDRWIDGLPEGRDALAKLCERVVDGLVQDFGRELVGAVLGYLRCALRGLRESELARLVEHRFSERARGDTFALLRRLRSHLEVVDDALVLPDSAFHRAAEGLMSPAEEDQLRRQLAEAFLESGDAVRRTEALWQLFFANEWRRVSELLKQPQVLIESVAADAPALRNVIALLERNSPFRLHQLYADVVACPAEHDRVLVAALAQTLESLGRTEGLPQLWIDIARRDGEDGDTRQQLRALYRVGDGLLRRGEFERALEVHRDAEAIARRAGDRVEEASAIGAQASVISRRGDAAAALPLYRRAARLQAQARDRTGLAVTCTNIGGAYDRMHRRRRALAWYRRSEELLVGTGHAQTLATCLFNQANVYWHLGEYARVLELLDRADQIDRALVDRHGMQRNARLRAQVLATRGDWAAAVTAVAEQTHAARGLGDPVELVHSLLDGSHVLEGAGAYVDALELLDEAREVCVRHAMSAALPGVLGARAGVLAHAGRPDELRVALAELEELTIGTSGGAG